MSSVKGLEHCSIEVDANACRITTGQPDPIVLFLQKTSEFMHILGGAIPSIINNSFAGDWRVKLDESIKNPLDDGEDEDTSFIKATDVLNGKKIRIFGKPAPHVATGNAEGNASWSLESEEFTSGNSAPNMDKAVLYIYVEDFEAVTLDFGADSTAPLCVVAFEP